MFPLIDVRQEAGIDNYYCIDLRNYPYGMPLGWTRLDVSELCDRTLDPTKLKVVFLDKRRVERWTNGDPPRSVCSQFIRWVRPDLTEEELRQNYSLIRVWEYRSALIFSMDAQLKEAPNKLERVFEGQFLDSQMFRRYVDNPRFHHNLHGGMPQFKWDGMNVDDMCRNDGLPECLAFPVLAFYYLKILTEKERAKIYLHPKMILPPLYERPPDQLERDAFHNDLNEFMTATRRSQRVGICYGVQKNADGYHALLFVYDAPNKRLEIYDPNGRDALYLRPPQPGRTIYDYFIRNKEYYRDQLAVCKIWSPAYMFQHEDKSCGWWAVVIGLQRMAGVHRRYLITDFRDLRSVMALIFSVIKSVCKFDDLTSCLHTIKDVDRALFRCVVPEERIAEIRALVTLPRSMFDDSPDVELCADTSSDDSSDSDDVHLGERK
jgi:hypothetical protein